MSDIGTAVVTSARGWIGTPYRHQCSTKGAGTDCLGLLRGVWREVIGAEPVEVPPYTPDWSEAAGREELLSAAERWLVPRPLPFQRSGDVLLFRMQGGAVAKHLGIVGQVGVTPSFIHAYSGSRVVESPLSTPWARRIVACFSFPGGID